MTHWRALETDARPGAWNMAVDAALLTEVERDDPQEVMARWTGNYRRGNERTAKNHPRNRR